MALSSAASVLKKAAARALLINVDTATTAILRDCFKQFNIDVQALPIEDAERLQREKVDAVVIWLDDKAPAVLETIRTSKSNRRAVIFGICGSVGEAIRYSKYGINVLLEKPVDRQNALRAVRTTHLLIIHEFRRYVRIPIVVKFDAMAGIAHVTGSTVEVSGGGMSVRYKGKLAMNDDIQVTFDLPGQAGIKVRGLVCWVRPNDSTAGVRFEPPEQPGRDAVRNWIDQYLEIL